MLSLPSAVLAESQLTQLDNSFWYLASWASRPDIEGLALVSTADEPDDPMAATMIFIFPLNEFNVGQKGSTPPARFLLLVDTLDLDLCHCTTPVIHRC